MKIERSRFERVAIEAIKACAKASPCILSTEELFDILREELSTVEARRLAKRWREKGVLKEYDDGDGNPRFYFPAIDSILCTAWDLADEDYSK